MTAADGNFLKAQFNVLMYFCKTKQNNNIKATRQ